MAAETAEKTWISGAEAARILELPDPSNLDALVVEGLVQKRVMPGCRRTYRRLDCVQLAKVMTLPAPRAWTEAAAR